jgi:hypothetical protein
MNKLIFKIIIFFIFINIIYCTKTNIEKMINSLKSNVSKQNFENENKYKGILSSLIISILKYIF